MCLGVFFSFFFFLVFSFFLWLHHFFTREQRDVEFPLSAIMSSIIALPTGVKVFNWCSRCSAAGSSTDADGLRSAYRDRLIGGMTVSPGGAAGRFSAPTIARSSWRHFHNVHHRRRRFDSLRHTITGFRKVSDSSDERFGRASFCAGSSALSAFTPLYLWASRGRRGACSNL